MRYLHFTEGHAFVKKALKLFGEEGIAKIEQALSDDPIAGVVIPGSGGIRKMRWRSAGRGKSGGSRIIYYFADTRGRIFLLDVYEKSEKTNLAPKELKELAGLVERWLQLK